MNKIETITDNNQGQLIREFGLLEEVLDPLGIIVVALATHSFDFTDLASASGSLSQ
jgi:hypothetical protein